MIDMFEFVGKVIFNRTVCSSTLPQWHVLVSTRLKILDSNRIISEKVKEITWLFYVIPWENNCYGLLSVAVINTIIKNDLGKKWFVEDTN